MKNLKQLTKSFFVMSFFALACFSSYGQKKKASPESSVKGEIDGVSITINYHSPRVKGREIYGDLVPWGKVWRAGANNATTIEFSDNVKINGESLEKGKYALFIIPEEKDNWTIVFNKVWEQWGAYDYDQSQDALRIKATPASVDPTENLTYTVENGKIAMLWADKSVAFPVSK